MIVRISKGSFAPDRLHDAEAALAASEVALRVALEAMPGLVHYYVAIDRERCQLTNVSVLETLDEAGDVGTRTVARAAARAASLRGVVRGGQQPRNALDDHPVGLIATR